jgi:N-methylhydantoinase A
MEQCRAQLKADGVPESMLHFRRIAECRYHGQGFELRADMPDEPLSEANKNTVIDSFHAQHKADYGYTFGSDQVEIMTLRVVGVADVDPLKWPKLAPANGAGIDQAYLYSRSTTFDDGETVETPRYDRDKLLAGHEIAGPALIVQHNSTTLVPPGYQAAVTDYGNIHIRAAASS